MSEIKKLEKVLIGSSYLYYLGINTYEDFKSLYGTEYSKDIFEDDSEKTYLAHKLTDDQFNSIVDMIRILDPENAYLKTVGWGFYPKSKKGEHICPPAALDEIRYPTNPTAYLGQIKMPKFDGQSVFSYYVHGELVLAITRGGQDPATKKFEGVVVTDKLKVIMKEELTRINVLLKEYSLVVVRGESMTRMEHKERILSTGEIPNIRNYAGGLLNRKGDYELLHELVYVAYSVIAISDTGQIPITKSRMLKFLEYAGFVTSPFIIIPTDIPDVSGWLLDQYKADGKDWEVDGCVLTQNQLTIKGTDKKYFLVEETSTKYKFESESKKVSISNVDWATGPSGKITPVAEFPPVLLSGASVSRATAHNAFNVKKDQIGIGSVIEITRSNEVIPFIKKVELAGVTNIPTNCPTCNTAITWALNGIHPTLTGAEIYCPNMSCPARSLNGAYRIIYTTGCPNGLGGTTINKWFEAFNVTDLNEFIDLIEGCEGVYENPVYKEEKLVRLKSILGDHYGTLIWELEENLVKKFKEGFYNDEFWFMLSLRNLADSNSVKMSSINPNDLTDKDQIYDVLTKAGLPEPVKLVVTLNIDFWRSVSKQVILLGERPKPLKAIQKINLSVCITGKLVNWSSRDDLHKLLTDNGVTCQGGVGKDTNYLICNKASSSGKSKDAMKIGVPIITEQEFLDKLKTDFNVILL